ncbi:MAG: hypothetical protein DRJ01_11125 [Bacteroidetes bacterium]|nr:MAG: hypothetical protein DRJ01_11125 [Bacteroidota bacterium]
MDIKELFKGVAVVIDDKINDKESGDLILNIIEKLEKENIPLLKYNDIPDENIISDFNNVSFILLDWELFEKPEGMYFDEKPFIDNVINFIKILQQVTFVPIFIFSHLESDTIITKLSEEDLYNDRSSNYIFVKKKSDLISDEDENKVFTEIENWLKQTPSIYVLKEWENQLNQAKNKLFWDFYNINHKWPSVLQKTFTDDGSDVNYELGNFIFKNIMARTEPIKFDEKILSISDDELSKDELRKVLEAERFIRNESLPDIPHTGDIFRYSVNGEKNDRYYLNIRPECDIARKRNPELYCLKGKIINEDDINPEEQKDNEIRFVNGAFIEKVNKIYLPFVIFGKIIEFTLNDIKIQKWNSIKADRIGRILPPYITAIQQKYSFYLQRQGLPAIPEKAIVNN